VPKIRSNPLASVVLRKSFYLGRTFNDAGQKSERSLLISSKPVSGLPTNKKLRMHMKSDEPLPV
jgi:hypothetical protein